MCCLEVSYPLLHSSFEREVVLTRTKRESTLSLAPTTRTSHEWVDVEVPAALSIFKLLFYQYFKITQNLLQFHILLIKLLP